MPVTTTPVTPSPAAGQYATLADLQAWQGTQNVKLYSDVENLDEVDTARVQAALDWADAEINKRLRFRGYAPLTESDASFADVKHIAVRLALWWLYNARDHRDDGDQVSETGAIIKANSWRKQAYIDLNDLVLNGTGSARVVSGAIGYPTVVE